jgi:AraC-like DNA-binding protein
MCNKGRDITEYNYNDNHGDAQVLVYHLFPGVEAAYITVHMADFDFNLFAEEKSNKCITIHFCKEGRIEQEVDQEFFYLMPGDCSFAIQNREKNLFHLPLKHYHGISINIDTDTLDHPFIDFLASCDCSPLEAADHICSGKSHIVLRSSEAAGKFFGELYEVEEEQRLDYLKVKMPELFYRMKYAKTDSSYYDRNAVPRTQVELVKSVSEYITENLNEKITIRKLTAEFGVSDTYLQKAFRSVYGMPVISFIRVQKMQSAAQVLIHTNRRIDEIAEEFGYENESKFSAAFKKIMGDTPGVYRKDHSKIQIL